MKTIYVNSLKIKLYTDIDELPIANFQKYNKFLLIDSGVGSDVDDVDTHIVRIARFIANKDSEKAMQELQNLRQNLYMISGEISPKHLAFTALIHSINDKELTDLSDSNLKDILTQINKVKRSSLIKWLVDIKKKLETELELYFPEDFVDVKEKGTCDKIKARILLQLDSMIRKNNNSQQIKEIDDFLFKLYKPKVFVGEKSAEIAYDKSFESACLLIAQKSSLDPKKMTTLQFYSALNNIKKQLEAETKSYKSNKH